MNNMINNLQMFLKEIYEKQGWDLYNPFVDSNFLLEEWGEVGECMIERADFGKFVEEIGDVLGALLSIGNRNELLISEQVQPKTITLNSERVYIMVSHKLGLLAREVRRKEIGRH